MNFHRSEISTVKKINLKKAYKILQTPLNEYLSNKPVLSALKINEINGKK